LSHEKLENIIYTYFIYINKFNFYLILHKICTNKIDKIN